MECDCQCVMKILNGAKNMGKVGLKCIVNTKCDCQCIMKIFNGAWNMGKVGWVV